MAETITSKIERLQATVDELYRRSEVSRTSEQFLPLGKNPFMRLPYKVEQMADRPNPGRMLFSTQRAIVINTLDPLLMNRVKIFCPKIHSGATEDTLPWAMVTNPFGSIDDQGGTFIPPAGSTVLVSFEGGERSCPIVIGSIYNVTRGSQGGEFQIVEENTLWGGTPGLRADGKNSATNADTNHLMPPWNNESYDAPDGSRQPASVPHIYGIKTPQKHFLQFVDGNAQKELRGKRVVLQSSKGSILMMKDDVLQSPAEIYNNPMFDDLKDAYPGLRYTKKPFRNLAIELKQTGVQLQSVGGGRLIISDETENDQFDNAWSSGWSPVGKLRSFLALESISGHQLVLRDNETTEGVRGLTDGIFMISACGNMIACRDHTIDNVAGSQRGITLWSTSNHRIDMIDYTAENSSEREPAGGVRWRGGSSSRGEMGIGSGNHTPNAKQALMRFRSGWGQVIELNDLGGQDQNADQYILIRNNNTDDPDCAAGPSYNYIRMECVNNGKLFSMWGAGSFLLSVCRNATRIVHQGSDLVIVRAGSHMTLVEQGSILMKADKGITHHSTHGAILLLAGEIHNKKIEHPPYPVVIGKDPFVCPLVGHVHYDTLSRHVIASE